MATCLDLMNKVLIALRQDTLTAGTTSTDTKYGLLVHQLVNEAKEEVEESWDWHSLRQTVTVTVAASQVTYTLTSAGDADVDTNYRTKLLYDKGPSYGYSETSSRGFGNQPQVFDVTDAGEYRLNEISWERMERMHLTDSDETSDRLSYFALRNDGTSLIMKVWPTPSEARTIKMRMFIPEAEIASTALTTTITVPQRPVYMLAVWKANAERGEEISMPGGFNYDAYMAALSSAIAREQTDDDITSHPV